MRNQFWNINPYEFGTFEKVLRSIPEGGNLEKVFKEYGGLVLISVSLDRVSERKRLMLLYYKICPCYLKKIQNFF